MLKSQSISAAIASLAISFQQAITTNIGLVHSRAQQMAEMSAVDAVSTATLSLHLPRGTGKSRSIAEIARNLNDCLVIAPTPRMLEHVERELHNLIGGTRTLRPRVRYAAAEDAESIAKLLEDKPKAVLVDEWDQIPRFAQTTILHACGNHLRRHPDFVLITLSCTA